jgi:electron transport complex protein RnfG
MSTEAKNNVRMVVSLAIFATVACVLLAFVYAGTKDRIAANQAAKLEVAQKEIFPEADSFKALPAGTFTSGNKLVTFGDAYKALKGGKTIGILLQSTSYGYQDYDIGLVGVDSSGKLAGLRLLQDKDSPGFGANAISDSYFIDKAKTTTFYGQFAKLPAKAKIAVQKDGGGVVAISGATITSRAVSLLVNEAVNAIKAKASSLGLEGAN